MLKIQTIKFGSVAVLSVQGRIVRGSIDPLRVAVMAQADASAIVIDLRRVNTIDACGLGVLLELREKAEANGIEFRLNNVTKLVRRILEITRLDSVFKVTDNNQMQLVSHRPDLSKLACCA